MTALPFCRSALRRTIFPVGAGLVSGILLLHQQPPMRFDALDSSTTFRHPLSTSSTPQQRKELAGPDIIRQISGGSLTGFLSGVLISVFSKTLVLLIGISLVAIQVAARNGLDLMQYFKLKERAEASRILTALRYNSAFKLAFAVTFTLSAFMSF